MCEPDAPALSIVVGQPSRLALYTDAAAQRCAGAVGVGFVSAPVGGSLSFFLFLFWNFADRFSRPALPAGGSVVLETDALLLLQLGGRKLVLSKGD